ncbi:hypothetical protein RhiirA1_464967 [Rhizophagus irregularis]|uniref:Uncharacterized protein n=1 Tax=Rhizophagus irregularis TaxID=588596 RepID=A0A2I1E2V3_9GLOM|nr:hypothetical protein RhiirA1_464967 [Rhizophagus irregularis]PKY16419.1 hypothetical protein RhiirB3_428792 [Rhizophagus irregularis]CAG8518595.1 17847_t:CDS:2 [Rhizophagus irregularis]
MKYTAALMNCDIKTRLPRHIKADDETRMDSEMQKYDQWGERTQHRGARQKGLLITISEYTYERIEHT